MPVDVHARVLVGDGQVVGVMSIARDLSERDRLENELRQAQKMVAVGRLATGIAHDFNNLITVLIGYSDELIEEAPDGSPVHHAAVAVRRVAERASGLTQQLLSFSRRQTLVSHTVDLNRIITHMEDMLRRLLGPEIRLDFRLRAHACRHQRRRIADQPGGDEPRRQCARCDAEGRHADHRNREYRIGRRAPRGDSRAPRPPDGGRHRTRHDRGGARSAVRAVLHDQGARPRHGSRPVDGARHRAAVQRPHCRGQQARVGHAVPGLFPATTRGLCAAPRRRSSRTTRCWCAARA